jgi:hypothetical protein
VGVERTFPLHSPKVERIEVAARGDVRRAKLYYLRERVGRGARVRERRWTGPTEAVQAGAMPPDDAPRPGEEELAEQTATEEAAADADEAGDAGAGADAPDEAGGAADADVPNEAGGAAGTDVRDEAGGAAGADVPDQPDGGEPEPESTDEAVASAETGDEGKPGDAGS